MVIVWSCLKATVLDCLMRTSMGLGEWELGTSHWVLVMSLELRWTEGSNGRLQVNSLKKSEVEGRPKYDMI